MSTFSICIGNYSTYSNGYLIDRWIDLPVSKERLSGFLESMQQEAQALTRDESEEFYVSDYDSIPLGLRFGSLFSEDTNIYHLNTLAYVMEHHPQKCAIVKEALGTGCDEPQSIAELINWILQADEIPYHFYNAPSWCEAAEEKMGYTCARDTEWYEALTQAGVEHLFDMHAYGLECAQYAHLGDNGYVDSCQQWPRRDKYSIEDIEAFFSQRRP